MIVNGKHYHTIWVDPNNPMIIKTIDQRYLPFDFKIIELKTLNDAFIAIKNMTVRGAPLIGVTAAYGMYLAILNYNNNSSFNKYLSESAQKLKSSRPTAINLSWAIDKMVNAISLKDSIKEKIEIALHAANTIKYEELKNSECIGKNGLLLIEKIYKKKNKETVNILTHCNAGWLACIDYGTALAPVYVAHDKGIKIHIWIDETRPRNQGAKLTTWELNQHGVPCTLITDNAGGHLMQNKMVDLVIVGSDRTTLNGDVANKIGTYLKAIAAYDNNIPFYVALPSSSIDINIIDGKDIPIEERDENEIKYMEGMGKNGFESFLITDNSVQVKNPGFDITPARFVTALITEKGICRCNKTDILKLFSK